MTSTRQAWRSSSSIQRWWRSSGAVSRRAVLAATVSPTRSLYSWEPFARPGGCPHMADDRLPVGMVTFAFTDIEGSTHLLQRLGVGYAPVLESYCAIMRDAFAAQGGTEFGAE